MSLDAGALGIFAGFEPFSNRFRTFTRADLKVTEVYSLDFLTFFLHSYMQVNSNGILVNVLARTVQMCLDRNASN